VVLHHGYGADSNVNWVANGVTAALSKAGRHVVAIDARGHGASDKPHDSRYYGERRMAQDLLQLVDRLAAPRVDLVGYSMGSIVALLAASRDARIRRLVIGGVGEAVVDLGGVDTRVLDNRALAAALRCTTLPDDTPPQIALFRRFTDALRADRLALAAHADVVHAEPIALAEIRAAALLIAGRDDALARHPERLAASIPGAELRYVAGDHFGTVLDPAFLSALTSFVEV
jgi:pimeloyl-ACP methyl ester carboxylesterase